MPDRLPAMEYMGKDCTNWDRNFALAVLDAPFDDVLPVALQAEAKKTGRAAKSVPVDPADPASWEWADVTWKEVSPMFFPRLVMKPKGVDDQTMMIEMTSFMQGLSVFDLIASRMPDISIVNAASNYETKRCYWHRLACWRDGQLDREVMLTNGLGGGGFTWEETGAPWFFEEPERYKSRRRDDRLNRALLFDYLRAAGAKLEAVLVHRQIDEVVVLSSEDWHP